MKILLLSRYEALGSSSRVRFYEYIPFLETKGINIQVAPFLTDDYIRRLYAGKQLNIFSIVSAYLKRIFLLLRSRTFDLLWVEKEILPWLPAWGEYLISTRLPYIVDYDDAVFHRYELHRISAIRKVLGKKIDRVMQYSTLVLAGNDYLASRARQAGANWVEILPSAVNVERYPIKKTRAGLNIGWIGSPATASFLNLIQPTLEKLVKYSDVRLTLVGANKIEFLNKDKIKNLSWSETTEIADLQTFDVGIMPLHDGPFERGKCGYKLIQYMASGLPVVASPIGVNRKIVEHDINGYLASTESEWFDALYKLKTNMEKRQQMGLAGRKKVETDYNIHITSPRLLDFFQRVVEQNS